MNYLSCRGRSALLLILMKQNLFLTNLVFKGISFFNLEGSLSSVRLWDKRNQNKRGLFWKLVLVGQLWHEKTLPVFHMRCALSSEEYIHHSHPAALLFYQHFSLLPLSSSPPSNPLAGLTDPHQLPLTAWHYCCVMSMSFVSPPHNYLATYWMAKTGWCSCPFSGNIQWWRVD